ncbi:MAG: hypothetical protein LBC94_07930 [Desulfovibrio sp.]|jgi:hypothetical protein|nr:hypothetical protein [Desulfovibrio sp.]
MSADAIARIEKLRGQKLSAEEAARLREIGDTLGLHADDAVWDILAAMEYQRVFYQGLPEKIAGASTEILRSIAVAAEKETAAAQVRLADCVVEQAKKLSVKINYASLLPMGLTALVCLLAFGSLLLWAGFCIGSGRAHPVVLWLHMPSGPLMGGLCLMGGILLGVRAAKNFAEGEKGWRKTMLAALAMLVAGGTLLGLAL